jgi:hypothetical protein
MTARRVWLALFLVACGSATARAGLRPAADAGGEFRFRRVYAPADGLNQWPGGAKYLPIESAEFDRLLSAAQGSSSATASAAAVRTLVARYEARLDPEGRIAGEGLLEIASTAQTPVLLPLEPCNLAVSKARWGDPLATPAVWGLASDGRSQLLVERSGQLRWQWSLAPRHDAADAVHYQFELPPCPVSRLTLDLPPKLVLTADRGLVLDGGMHDGLHRWQIELGGHVRFRLSLLAPGAAGQRSRLVLARQSTTYEISLHGLELSSQLRLEAHQAPLSEIPLWLEPPLQLVSAMYADAPLAWSVRSAPGDRPGRVVLALPRPLREGTGVVRLRAVAPLLAAQSWKLPRLLPEDCFWQDGSATLVVSAPLWIEQFQSAGCRQSGFEPLAAPRSGESLQLEFFGPDATLELSLAQRQPAVQITSGTAMLLGEGKINSRVTADFRTADAAIFTLEAEVTPSWTIDSVESLPADALDDWTVESRGGGRRLALRLAKPLVAARSLRLVIAARRLYASAGRSLAINDLVPLRFPGSADDRRFMSLRPLGAHALKLAGAERLRQVNPQRLTAAELDLFDQPPTDLLFLDDAGARQLRVSLEDRRPTYAATLHVEATAGGGGLQESYRLVCTPAKSSPVDRVVARFSRRRAVPPRWSLAGEEEGGLTARPAAPEQPKIGPQAAEGETWDLALRRPHSGPFEIRAVRETPLAEPQAVSLATLPEAASQQATLVVRSLGPQPLRIKNNRLKPLPSEPVLPSQYQTTRATYQYDPPGEAAADAEPALVLSAAAEAALPTVWAWNCELQSQLAADGSGQHCVAYRLQSTGAARIRLTLPPAATPQDVQGIWVDDHRASVGPPADAEPGTFLIDLPAGERFPKLCLQFTTLSGGLRVAGWLAPLLPEVDCPVLARHWTVWLPPGYEACRFLPDRGAAPLRPVSCSQRLLGTLGRAPGEPVFDPLSAAAWLAAVGLGPRPGAASATIGDLPVAAGKGAAADAPAVDEPLPTADAIVAPRLPAGSRIEGTVPLGSTEADASPLCGETHADAAGWNAYRLELPATPFRLAYVHRPTVCMAGWVVCLLVIAVGAWTLVGRPVLLVLLAGALGVAGMLAPPAFLSVLAGALLGTLCCLALGLFRRARAERPRPDQRDETAQPPSTVSRMIPFGVPVLAAMLLGGGALRAADTAKPPRPVTYSVFIPVDAQQQPTGGKYFLSEDFYDRLYRRAAMRSEKPQGWLIAGAAYRGTLAKDAASQRLLVDRLTAGFDLLVYDAAARVRIPFRHAEAKLLPGEARLDDRPVQPEWEADGSALVIEVAQPGEYRLELALRPTMRGGSGPAGFDLAIPRVVGARLELAAAGNLPALEIPSAAGAVRWDSAAAQWTAELGPADQLSLRWSDAAAEAAAPAVDAEQLLWLRLLPGSVFIDAKLKLKVVAGQLQRLQWAVDPGLQMLPLAGPDAPLVRAVRTTAQMQLLELQWPRGIADAATVEARFLWTGVSGVGNLRLPQLEVLDARPTRRWLAVSVDPALEYRAPPLGPGRALAVPEFTGAWGPAGNVPQFACRLPLGPAECDLATHPRRPETTVDQTLALVFDETAAEVRFDAQLATAAGYVFQHRILAPPALHVERISVTAEGVGRLARWTQDPKGLITVFLTGPLSGRQELQLRGSLPVARPDLPLPILHVDGARTQSSIVQLFRQPWVLVALRDADGLAEIKEPPADSGRADTPRLVQAFRADPAVNPRAVLTVTPNQPECYAEQLTRMVWEDGGWKAVLHCRLHVTRGAIDEIVIDVAEGWSGPYKLSPAAAFRGQPAPGPQGPLLLQPRTAVAGDFSFTVAVPLVPATADRVAVPDIRLRQPSPARRIVVLPAQLQNRPISWEVQGLRAIGSGAARHSTRGQPVSEPWQKDLPPAGQATAYEVIGETWQAVLSSTESQRPAAHVRLADIRYACQAGGGYRGAATFDVDVGNVAECALALPAGAALLSLAVAGVPVDPVPAEAGQFGVPLSPDLPSQRVEVLFTGEQAAGQASPGADRQFSAPSLRGLPAERTIWTIAGPPSCGPGVADEAGPIEPRAIPPDPPGGIAAVWQATVDRSQAVTRYALPRDRTSISLHYDRPEPDPWPGRLLTGAVWAALAAAAVPLVRRGTLRYCFARWPYVFGVGLGLAWWLWLWPSILGLAIVLAVLFRLFYR